MKSFASKVVINAAPERVWAILTESERYTAWNSTVSRVEGHIAKGETVKVHATISPGRVFPVKVTALDAPRRMVWTGGMPLGLFKGERVFDVLPAANGATEFSMRESFTGPLAPIFGRMIPDLQPAFDDFARDLKHEAERVP